MTDSTTFSTRSNAKRAAEKAIDAGSAPSIDYGLRTREDGRIEIVWTTGPTPAEADEQDAEVARQAIDEIEAGNERIIIGDELQERFESWEERVEPDAVAEASAEPMTNPSDGEGDMPDIFPPGTRVIVQVSARKRRTGAIDYRVDARSCRVKFDGPQPSVLCRYSQLSLDDGSAPLRPAEKPPRKPPAGPSGDRKPSRRAELDAAAAHGEMPAKPIITSKANKEQYQKRFDQLEKWAMAGDWNAIRGYEVKGINSYAKMLKQYRDRLLAAHAASAASDEAA